MKPTCSLETQDLLIKIFAQTNPIYTIGQIQTNPNLAASLKEFLFPTKNSHSLTLHGNLERIKNACNEIDGAHAIRHDPVVHVFPVYQSILDECFMVPLKSRPNVIDLRLNKSLLSRFITEL